ncbi:hypothetical protein TNCV_1961101 [Trichonephila clavipes]|nr:hypothetical protein TNCV_1961101 [Trichonephila clavipes]
MGGGITPHPKGDCSNSIKKVTNSRKNRLFPTSHLGNCTLRKYHIALSRTSSAVSLNSSSSMMILRGTNDLDIPSDRRRRKDDGGRKE